MKYKLLWAVLIIAVLLLMLYPVVYDIIRLGIVVGWIAVWMSGIYLFRKNRAGSILFICVLAFVILAGVLPGREADSEQLRKAYIKELLKYENVKYVWGGETRLGIDCSGLVRKAYADANLKLGLTTLNPRLIRKAVRVWSIDCGAKVLGSGYRGMTKPVGSMASLDKLTGKDMKAGYLVVAKEGFHILAYIGDNTLIEASPKAGKVRRIAISDKAKEWKGVAINIVRWSDM